MIKILKSKILASVQSKRINVFLLFLLFAFIILVLVKLSKNYINTINFKIDKVNIKEEHIIINDSNNELKLTLKAHGFKLLQYYFGQPHLKIDFSENVERRDSTYIWDKNEAYASIRDQFDKQVEIVNVSPDILRFRYDVNSVKKVPVVLNQEIQFSPGFDVMGSFMISPDSIKVIGPSALISEISTIETETISLENVKQNISRDVNLILPDREANLKFLGTSVVLSGTVEKFTEGKLKIPVIVKNIPEGLSLKYFPRAVNVSYYTSLSNFNAVTANDFKVECDYAKINGNQSFLIPEIVVMPQSVKNAKILNKRVEFIIVE